MKKWLGKDLKGKVKFFNPEKNYGFIVGKNTSADGDIFFHGQQWNVDLNVEPAKSQHVIFDLVKTNKGYSALNVRLDPDA